MQINGWLTLTLSAFILFTCVAARASDVRIDKNCMYDCDMNGHTYKLCLANCSYSFSVFGDSLVSTDTICLKNCTIKGYEEPYCHQLCSTSW